MQIDQTHSKPSILQAEPPQLAQPIFQGEMLQSPDGLHGTLLDSFQQCSSLVLGSSELNAVLQVKDPLLRPAGKTPKAVQNTFSGKGTLLAYDHLGAGTTSRALSAKLGVLLES